MVQIDFNKFLFHFHGCFHSIGTNLFLKRILLITATQWRLKMKLDTVPLCLFFMFRFLSVERNNKQKKNFFFHSSSVKLCWNCSWLIVICTTLLGVFYSWIHDIDITLNHLLHVMSSLSLSTSLPHPLHSTHPEIFYCYFGCFHCHYIIHSIQNYYFIIFTVVCRSCCQFFFLFFLHSIGCCDGN